MQAIKQKSPPGGGQKNEPGRGPEPGPEPSRGIQK
jgi:hypothetical protein